MSEFKTRILMRKLIWIEGKCFNKQTAAQVNPNQVGIATVQFRTGITKEKGHE